MHQEIARGDDVIIFNRVMFIFLIFTLAAVAGLSFSTSCHAVSCETVVNDLNDRLDPKVETEELVDILRTLNATKNRKLPPKFITKKEASGAGWKPGTSLWSVNGLRGKSIGGDRFGNYEKKLPNGTRKWREADLDYHGGRRGPKRIVFSKDGLRMITVDHYQTFREVRSCQ
ncbi:MAG: barnase family single strand ribonuclease [Deltaproteobacteria bacterium]|nr:barnase family single strand ribonuclease [Deltaproteobacteria bacterium]